MEEECDCDKCCGFMNGAQGFMGTQGAAALGSQGPIGFQADVAIGAQGCQGFQGDLQHGPQGFDGVQGFSSQTSELIGPQGIQGWPGSFVSGAQGFFGDKGQQGFASLLPQQGTRGFQGDNLQSGFQGYRGMQGETTNPGPQGPSGFQGTAFLMDIQDVTTTFTVAASGSIPTLFPMSCDVPMTKASYVRANIEFLYDSLTTHVMFGLYERNTMTLIGPLYNATRNDNIVQYQVCVLAREVPVSGSGSTCAIGVLPPLVSSTIGLTVFNCSTVQFYRQ